MKDIQQIMEEFISEDWILKRSEITFKLKSRDQGDKIMRNSSLMPRSLNRKVKLIR